MSVMGRFWEDFRVSDEFTTSERTISDSDVLQFAGLSGDLNPIHTDLEYCRSLGLRGLVPQTNLVIALASGLIFRLGLFDGTGVGLRSITWRTNEPIEVGETIRCTVRIAELRELDASHGVLVRDIEVLNQRNQVSQTGSHEEVVLRKP